MDTTYRGITTNPKPLTLKDWLGTKEGKADFDRVAKEVYAATEEQGRQIRMIQDAWAARDRAK